MAISVKLAMSICAICIAAGSWYLPSVQTRQADMPSVLVPRDYPTDNSLARASDWTSPAQGVGGRARVGHQLSRRNPLETEMLANRSSERSLTVVMPSASGPQGLELPPLAYEPPPPPIVAQAEPLATEGAPEFAAGAGTLAQAAQSPDSAAAPTPAAYRVAKGDSLSKIAWQQYKSRDPRIVKAITELNPAVSRRAGRLLVGEELQIPDAGTVQRVLAGQPLAAEAPVVANAAGSGDTVTATDGDRWYTIQRNDSLTSIAKRHLDDPGRWREILKLNRALDPHKIVPGVRIKLPPAVRMAAR